MTLTLKAVCDIMRIVNDYKGGIYYDKDNNF